MFQSMRIWASHAVRLLFVPWHMRTARPAREVCFLFGSFNGGLCRLMPSAQCVYAVMASCMRPSEPAARAWLIRILVSFRHAWGKRSKVVLNLFMFQLKSVPAVACALCVISSNAKTAS